jgi:hypothetical protein
MAVVNRPCLGHAFAMRFYMLPAEQGTTTLINFDHVAYINIAAKTIELHFIGVEAPMVITKTPTTLSLVAKGMDLSDNSKDLVSAL